ncbi:4-hydroxybenzoate polyprenyltransferase [Arthrobacter sp. 2762]
MKALASLRGLTSSARCRVLANFPKVYGPRGMVMLGKALMCACFGFSYLGVLPERPQPALEMVTRIFPLEVWAVVWFLVAFMLVASAFKVDQSRALGAVAGLLSLWALSFAEYFFRTPVLPNGTWNTAFVSAALLASMALSAAGCARMMNHAPSHPEIVQKPGDPQ